MSDDKFWQNVEKKVEDLQIKIIGQSVKDHPALGNFTHDRELLDLSVAQSWGKSPTQFEKCSYADKVTMYAWFIVNKQIQLITNWEMSIKRQAQGKILTVH